jgi:F-type H+-transporting ATPase subunit gamma
MKTVASIRLRRAETRLEAARPYQRALAGLVARVTAAGGGHPFLQTREKGPIGVVLITSDRGLCGGYNASAVRRALLLGGPGEVGVVAVGRRGQVQMAHRGYEIVERFVPLGGEPDMQAVRWLADRIGDLYAEGRFAKVVVVFSRFLGGVRYEVRADTLLPLAPGEAEETDIIFEPPLTALLPGVLRRCLRGQLAAMVLESSASEHAARVAAMAAATDNAEEMMRDLTLAYNKARQAGITKELTEIVGASEASA